jgi:hypothetical protein
MDFIKTDQKNGIKLVEYKEKFYLHAAREGTDGKVYDDWAFPENRDRKPNEKAIPVKVALGDKERAIKTLFALLMDFGVNPRPDDTDVPF